MKATTVARTTILLLVLAGLTAGIGCDTATRIGQRGGAEIWIQGVSTGAVSMQDKPISGLPSETVSLVLDVSASKVSISTTNEETIIELSPSGGSIVLGPDGVSVSGVEPDQIEMRWQDAEQDE